MSNLATSTGRKKLRTKESKAPAGGRSDRTLSSLPSHLLSSTAVVDDGSAMAFTDMPYVCVGRFAVDFVQLCRRAHLSYIPHVITRPHRPASASLADEKRSNRSTSFSARPARLVALHAAPDQSLAVDAAEGFIPEPPPKTYVVRDSISFFRPCVQVLPHYSVNLGGKTSYCIIIELFCCVTEVHTMATNGKNSACVIN